MGPTQLPSSESFEQSEPSLERQTSAPGVPKLHKLLSKVERLRTLLDEVVKEIRSLVEGCNETHAKRKRPEGHSVHILTPEEVRAVQEKLGLSVKDAAEKVGVKPSTWYEWENTAERLKPSLSHAKLLYFLAKKKL